MARTTGFMLNASISDNVGSVSGTRRQEDKAGGGATLLSSAGLRGAGRPGLDAGVDAGLGSMIFLRSSRLRSESRPIMARSGASNATSYSMIRLAQS